MIMKTLKPGLLAVAISSAGHAALAGCPADGATPFTAGSVDAVNGFAEYVQDSQGLALELCLDAANCIFDPVIPNNAFSALVGFGAEAFWWLSEPVFDHPDTIPLPSGLTRAVLVMAAEAAWADEVPGAGEQFPFTRLRLRLDVNQPGFYRVTHPYGQQVHHIAAVGVGLEVNESYDIRFSPAAVNQGRVGPWLTWDPIGDAPAGFIGDATTPHLVTGSPCGTNYFRIEAFTNAALTIPLTIDTADVGADGGHVVQVNHFTVAGKRYTGPPPPVPMVVDRASYSRAVDGRVSVLARAPTTANVTFSGAANLPAGEHSMASDGSGRFFGNVSLQPDGATLPATIQVTANNPGNAVTSVPQTLVDVVRITRADYHMATGTLTIEAASSDRSPTSPPTLTAAGLGVLNNGATTTSPTVPPTSVTVTSSAGGSDTRPVTIINPVTP